MEAARLGSLKTKTGNEHPVKVRCASPIPNQGGIKTNSQVCGISGRDLAKNAFQGMPDRFNPRTLLVRFETERRKHLCDIL